MEPVTARLKDAYRENSTTEVNEAVWQATRAVCVHNKHVRLGAGRGVGDCKRLSMKHVYP